MGSAARVADTGGRPPPSEFKRKNYDLSKTIWNIAFKPKLLRRFTLCAFRNMYIEQEHLQYKHIFADTKNRFEKLIKIQDIKN